MKLTKYDHVCFILEEQGQKVIVDPGGYEDIPPDISNALALIITHEHADHFNPDNVAKIKQANPDVQIFASEEVATQIDGAIAPDRNKSYTIGPFTLEFFGDMHAQIHPEYPGTHNISVLINDIVYYPGDVLLKPPKQTKILLMPTSAPWMKASEGMDFLTAAKVPKVIPTHDALISEAYGKPLYDRLLGGAVQQYGGTYQRLGSNESIEV